MKKLTSNLIKLSASVAAVALFIPTSVSTANTKSTIALKDAAKTSLSTIFGGNTKDFGRVNHILSVSEIISKLRQAITNSNYIPVINELIVSSPANTGGNTYTSNISVDGNSTEFDGTLSVIFTYDNTKVVLSTVITRTDIEDSGWSGMPSMKTFLTKVRDLPGNTSLNLNSVSVDMAQAAFDVPSNAFKVVVTPKLNSSIYTGSVWITWRMNKATLASSFPNTVIRTPYPFIVPASDYYAPDALQAACEQNNVSPMDISSFGYTVNTTGVSPDYTRGNIVITITAGNNPRWDQNQTVTLSYEVTDLGHFDLTSTQLTEQGWTGLTSGGMRFVITDNINNHVIMGNGSHYRDVSMSTITGNAVHIPSTIRYAMSGVTKTYTITGFDKGVDTGGASSGFYGASIHELYFPASLNCFLPKDCFRLMGEQLVKVIFDPASIVTGSSWNEPLNRGGDVFYSSFPKSGTGVLDLPPSFSYWGREYFFKGQCPSTVILRNPNRMVQYRLDGKSPPAPESGFDNNTRKVDIYVPDTLLDTYNADTMFWKRTGDTAANNRTFKKLSDLPSNL